MRVSGSFAFLFLDPVFCQALLNAPKKKRGINVFESHSFGAVLTVGIALIGGKQADCAFTLHIGADQRRWFNLAERCAD